MHRLFPSQWYHGRHTMTFQQNILCKLKHDPAGFLLGKFTVKKARLFKGAFLSFFKKTFSKRIHEWKKQLKLANFKSKQKRIGAKCGPIIFGTKKISIYQTRTSSPLTQRAKLSVVVRLTPGPYSFAKLWSWFISDDSVLHILLLICSNNIVESLLSGGKKWQKVQK